MKKFWKRITSPITKIDFSVFWKSFYEVAFMTVIALLPLITNIAIAAIVANEFIEPVKTKIIPGEILSYCLSFIAPSLYLLTKIQGSTYKLPLLHAFSIITLVIYVLTFVLYLITKNNWVKEINLSAPHPIDIYFKLTLIFLAITIIFRIYSIYHTKKSSNWSSLRSQQQEDFNSKFSESLNLNK